MHKVIAMLLLGAATVGGVLYYRNEAAKAKADASDPDGQPKPLIEKAKDKAVTVVSPLAQWMDNSNPADDEEKAVPLRKPNPKDRIADSPVGTSTLIVHKTFAVSFAAKFPFEVPAHAANPQMRGTFHSFAQAAGADSSDGTGDVDLLLMNDQQYADFLQGYRGDVVYSIDASHDQDVSFGLPATMDHPAQYYLVFRNASSKSGKKVVQANFQVDF